MFWHDDFVYFIYLFIFGISVQTIDIIHRATIIIGRVYCGDAIGRSVCPCAATMQHDS